MNPPTNQPFVGEEVYRRYLDGPEPLAERRHFCRLGRGRTAERTAAHPPKRTGRSALQPPGGYSSQSLSLAFNFLSKYEPTN